MRTLRTACLAIALMLPAVASAQVVTIDFDTAPGGAPVASGAVVDSLYASLGVTFSRTTGGSSCNSGNIFANNDRPGDFTISSSPNVVSQCSPPQASDVSEGNFGAIRADLASAASQACIDVRPDGGGDSGVLRAYDAGATLVGTTTSAAGVIQQICVSAPGIRRVEFSGAGSTFARFDDLVLTFSAAPPPSITAPVPATSPLGLAVLLGLLALAGAARLARR